MSSNFGPISFKQYSTSEIGDMFSSLLISLFFVAVIGGLFVAIGLILSKSTTNPPNLLPRNVQSKPNSKPIVPVVQPKSLAPKITKVEVPTVAEVVTVTQNAPTLEPKSITIAPVVVPEEKKEEEKVAIVSEKNTNSIDDTFEAYRQAMLASGPRQMEEEARAELQSKNGSANSSVWREQTATLRQSLKDETAAAFLERTNTSINDRMVAIFDAVKA